MKIAVIGAGFTGLAAARELSKKNNEVYVFEKDKEPGGLAVGFDNNKWNWTLEKHYHHWFSNDNSVLNLAKEIGYKVVIKRPKTSVYVKGKIYQLDSPMHALKFPLLPLPDKLRMGISLALLKFNPWWKPLEKFKTHNVLLKTMGKKSYEMIWEPQLKNKFREDYQTISLAWFWARIKKRTPKLVYPSGGFLDFAKHLVKESEKKNVKFFFGTEVEKIRSGKKISVKWKMENARPAKLGRSGGKWKIETFDAVIVTLPSFFFIKIAPDLPKDYKEKLLFLKGLGAINLILRLKKPFLTDGTYWLSVCENNAPVMAIVEHTNFMDKKNYNNEHIVYLGNYLPAGHEYFSMDKEQLLQVYDSLLREINPNYKSSIINSHLFKVPFAQPIIPTNYSKKVPSFETPIPNVFLANIQQVYPWDRGTNYAVELGQEVAKLIEDKS